MCTRCVSGYVPINGVCQPYPGSASSVRIPEEAESSIRCIKCKPNENVFLFYGGCYTVDRSAVGGQICSRASNGRCVECNVSTHGAYVFTNPNETAEERCIACSDSIGFSGYGGVLECYSCTQPVTGGKLRHCALSVVLLNKIQLTTNVELRVSIPVFWSMRIVLQNALTLSLWMLQPGQ